MKGSYKNCHGIFLALIFAFFHFGQESIAKSGNSKKTDSVKENDSIEESASSGTAVGTGVSSVGSCLNESFQVPSLEAKPVDVLFVMETSPSMNDVRPRILEGIAGFVSKLPVNSDFNIAVMLSHGGTSPLSGKLYQTESEPMVLKTSTMSKEQIIDSLRAKLTQVPVDVDAGGGEEGIFSLFQGVTSPTYLAASQAAGFFRANAALSIVFIADRRDICANVPVGVPEEADPVKVVARFRDCEGVTASGLVNRLNQLKGSQPLLISGLIYTGEPVPEGKEIGYGYKEVIMQSNGLSIDLAQDDVSAGLGPIIELGGQSSPGQNIFTLARTDIDPATLKVNVEGQEVPFVFENSQVTVTVPVSQGATVAIAYCVKTENPFVGLCETFENADQWSLWEPALSTQDVELKNRSGNHALGAVRNLLIQNVSGKLRVDSAMEVSMISGVSGNSHFHILGDIASITNVNGSVLIDKAGDVGLVTGTNGSFQMNARTLGAYRNGSGNACVRAESIGKIESMNGHKTFIATRIEELSALTGEVHVFGAEVHSVINTGGKICLHNGAKVLSTNNVTGFIGQCP